MARANNGGWDFVKVGQSYQYKEDWFIAKVTILEDNSNMEEYRFKLQVEESSMKLEGDEISFEISHAKDPGGYYSGMLQLYEQDEYQFTPVWKRKK